MAKPTGRVTLWIHVDQQRLLTTHRQAPGEVDSRRRFTDAAFLVRDADGPWQCCFLAGVAQGSIRDPPLPQTVLAVAVGFWRTCCLTKYALVTKCQSLFWGVVTAGRVTDHCQELTGRSSPREDGCHALACVGMLTQARAWHPSPFVQSQLLSIV